MAQVLSSTRGTEMAVILPLEEIGARMLPLVGGKAANLGELIATGFPVPRGFCVTTEAYVTGPMPSPVAEAIGAAYEALGSATPVAVRSSATAEDLPWASFAGQHDTFLDVVGREAVLDAVRRCWASLWTDRAVSYRERNGIDHATVRLAVVVQVMVDAEVAGVLFTANPVTGRRRQAVIDASPGLGEAVVSGSVNPDHFVVDPDASTASRPSSPAPAGSPSGDIVERRVAGGTACLTDDQIRALTALGQRVEEHYGAPQDIEWAIDAAGRLWLTQARAITTLYPLPAGATEDPLRVYFSFNVAQGVERPFTPMGLSAFKAIWASLARTIGRPVEDPLAGPPFLAEAGERLFIDLTGALRSSIGRSISRRMFGIAEARSAAVVELLLQDPRLGPVDIPRRKFFRAAGTAAVRGGVPRTLVRALLDPAATRARLRELPGRLRHRAQAVGNEDALSTVERLFAEEFPAVALAAGPIVLVSGGIYVLAGKLLGEDATTDERQAVLRSLPHNVTTEMDLELWRLARRLRGDPAAREVLLGSPTDQLAGRYHAEDLPPALQRGLAGFLGTYGHRTVAEIDLGLPRWAEDPTHILGVLANYLRLDDPDREPDVLFERGRQQAEAMVAELTRRARERGRLRGAAVGLCLRRVRALNGLREMPKFCLVVLLGEARRLLQGVGEELASAGRLRNAEDIFFLDLAEARRAKAGQDLRDLVAERRAVYERELRRRHVPRILLSDGSEPEAEMQTRPACGGLTGTPASAGVATGPARVILDPTGARLEPGEILVAPSTDPGWTPLFLTAGGLVMEMGGAMSHGAVVAREYGIPAVVGVAGATERLRSGQLVTVDGSAGTVQGDQEEGAVASADGS
ncbi:MAG: PEP/pyruvate-binding domain-containing protein [Egibacteraceae bacterium]